MKKLTTISLFIFFAVVVAVFVSGLIYMQKNGAGSSEKAQYPSTGADAIAQPGANEQGVGSGVLSSDGSRYSLDEVAKHNSSSDCWSIVNGKVYNVTSLISGHTGGSEAIIAGCGKDATQAFNTRGTNGPHPERAAVKLEDYYVGVIGAAINTSVQQTNAVTPKAKSNDKNDDGEDDD